MNARTGFRRIKKTKFIKTYKRQGSVESHDPDPKEIRHIDERMSANYGIILSTLPRLR